MSKIVVGSIPEKIAYVHSGKNIKANIGCEWELGWYADYTPNTIDVFASFPVDANDTKAVDRAKEWACNRGADKSAHIDVFDNKPIEGIKICSLEERYKGGRAYKVTIDKYYVDLREDVLVDAILHAGIKEGGVLQGQYIWCKVGAQMKLVRLGSELHKFVLEFENRKKIKTIKKNELEVGGIYEDRKNSKAIFLGYVNTTFFSLKEKRKYDHYSYRNTKASFDFNHKEYDRALLFFSLYDFEKEKPLTLINKELKERGYRFKIVKSHNYINKIGQEDVPENIPEKLRTKALDTVKDNILKFFSKEPNAHKISDVHLEDEICFYSSYLNLSGHDKDKVSVFDIKKYFLLS